MPEIQLTKGKVSTVSQQDYDELSKYSWYAKKDRNVWYACTVIGGKEVRMHRKIMGIGSMIDHINGDGLDNRRENLRACSNQQNQQNQHNRINKTGFKGVYVSGDKYIAQIRANGKQLHLGRFMRAEEAAIAYDQAARKYFGSFAQLNFRNS